MRQAHIDDVGRRAVDDLLAGRVERRRHARRPANAGNDVGQFAAAAAEHAHRDHGHVPGAAGDADAVVGGRRADRAGDMRAVIRILRRRAAAIAGILGVGVDAVAVAAAFDVGDEIDAGRDIAGAARCRDA